MDQEALTKINQFFALASCTPKRLVLVNLLSNKTKHPLSPFGGSRDSKLYFALNTGHIADKTEDKSYPCKVRRQVLNGSSAMWKDKPCIQQKIQIKPLDLDP